MKRWFFILAATLLYLAGQAQPYGNEWIEDFDQRYLKVAVTSEGIYRIEYTTLKQALLAIGVDADALDPRNFQVFGRGEELYIHVENGGAVDSFDPGDFVEFYAEGNDGWLDDRMFVAPNVPANPYHSLINDTATYYFTWNNSVNNRRLNLQGYTNLNQSASQFFLQEEVGFWASRYFRGALGPFGKADPEYVSGEGWFSGEFGTPSAPNSVNRSLATGEVFTGASAPAARIAMVYTGISNASVVGLNHQISLAFSTTPGGTLNVLNSLQYNGYELRQDSFSLSPAQLGPATTTFHFITPSGAFTDKSAASHVYLKYPHTYNLEGRSALSMILPSTNGSFTFINASNFNGNNSPVFYDLTGHSRISADPSAPSGTFRVNVPGGGERQCYVSATTAITSIAATNLQPVGTNGRFFNYSTLDPDSAFVIVSHPRVISGAQDYANYRQSTGYDVVLANIEDLYHQFGYGITKHPLAIRGFADFILDTWTTPAQYLFLIGKSVNPEDSRNSTVNHSNNLVPTMGIPSSDNRITARLNGTLFAPAIATGRLSAQTNTDVTIYLDKVQAFETLLNSAPNTESERLWMKRILNFGGGQTQGEQVAFRNFLGNYETILSDTNFGGFASSFFKTTSNPVQVTVSDTIKTLLREGTAIMNFFGHAGGNTFDISIDDPEDWDNQNRYPFLVANSCFAGDIHKPVANVGSTSEEYVLVPNRGVIAFLSSVDLGFPTSLDDYTNALYRHISSIDYGAPIGRQMQFAVQDIQSNDLIVKSTALEFTLHGDPALSVYSFPLPDFVVSEDRVLVSPSNVTTALDSFDLQVVITNLGRGVDKPFQVKVTREFPNNSTPQAVSQVVTGIQFRDTVNFRFPVDQLNGVGINTFTIEVDPPVPVPQINERDNFFNNRTTKTVVISSDELFPIYPYDFAVVPTSNVTLKASTGDPFAPLRTYRFQIDTTDLFTNPQQIELTQTGGVLNWTPNLQAFGLQDSMVFFWRTAPIPEAGEAFKWREHSFQYIPARNGWSQDHFFQFENNAYNAIQHNRANRQFDYTPTVGEVRCVVLGNPTNQLEITESHYRLNGNIEEESFCQSVNRPGMNIVVLDSVTLRPWGTYWIDNREAPPVVFNEDHQFGNVLNLGPGPSCNRDRVQFYFAYHLDDPVQMDSMISLITARVPKGNYILAYTTGRGRFQDPNVWQPQQFQAFKDLGAQIIETVNDSVPYIFFTKAGYPGSAREVIGTDP
ncbi:MAG: C25 family cysteine peptidase, partial [Bacteroidota bacterium]